jgi:hypothetical protein
MDEDRGPAPKPVQAAFESELAIRREAALEARRKASLWFIGAGMACGYVAGLAPRLLLDPAAKPGLLGDQTWGVLMLAGGTAAAAVLGALALYLRDRTWTELRDFSLCGLAVAALQVVFG